MNQWALKKLKVRHYHYIITAFCLQDQPVPFHPTIYTDSPHNQHLQPVHRKKIWRYQKAYSSRAFQTKTNFTKTRFIRIRGRQPNKLLSERNKSHHYRSNKSSPSTRHKFSRSAKKKGTYSTRRKLFPATRYKRTSSTKQELSLTNQIELVSQNHVHLIIRGCFG
ncbi:hypothetical protein BO70DRAFT_130545 [Aspergillus heteromorphus CBS 117.55]|uniref:Uncharacterized protein n=1 Tax=Aspergillus heteromorphus CBS 117.55 TaxID=1448321 RepID=A0A317WYU1_9EURO|nr:uncharacterized protein BO70DRAFT_130545 [Aspergillus heteromorphus CBS 117.55]PWY89898.1 hypothetical protein BO70DRAFT_130545 [Aspergillus heteromorphus CBS 117.55]